jgi:signal transduction histidine kinase
MFVYLLLLIAMATIVFIGYAAIISKIGHTVNRWFFISLSSIFIWVLTNAIFRNLSLSIAYVDALISYGSALSLSYSSMWLVISMNNNSHIKNKYFIPSTILFLIMLIVSVFPGGISSGLMEDYSIITNGRATIYSVAVATYLGFTIVYALYQSKRNKILSYKQQYKIIFYGFMVSAVMGALFNLILPTLFNNYRYVSLGPASSIIYIYSILYAISKHKLFDIKSSAFRAVGYTFALLSIGFIGTLVVLRTILPIVGQGSDYDPQVYAVTFLAVIFVSWVTPKFRKFFDRITYKIFYRNSYDPLLFAGQISAVVTSNPKTTDLQKGLLKLYHKAFGSQYIQIIVNHAEDEAFNQKQLEIGQTLGVGAPSEVLKFYERLFIGHEHKNKFVLRSKIDFEEGSEEARLLDQYSIGMIAKLKLNRRIVGYLVFGDKTSGTLYTLEDIALITGHYSEVAIALQNSTRYNRIATFNLELQEKINVATFKLKKSNARLRKLDRAKDDFLSIASHQLRTPLTVVRGNIDLVANGDLGPITKEAKGVLVQSERSAGRLSDLINDFLSTSRLKTGKFILTPSLVNLKFTVEQQIEQLIDFAAQRGIELVLHKVDDNLPVINADEEKLRQVMLNTIDNAIYYSARHSGKVDVALYNDGKNIVYKVKDNGIGVPANEKSKMFTRMYRADNAKNARPDGNGLGLFLMKKIIDAHHGEIIFESEEGKGSTFGFKLALNPKVELTKQAIT